jgi:hypothetical protein
MRIQFRKLDLVKILDIPPKTPILFVEYYKGLYIETYVGTIESCQNFRNFQLYNSFTHWLILPKVK